MTISIVAILIGIPFCFANGFFQKHATSKRVKEFDEFNKPFEDRIAEQQKVCPNGWNPYLMMAYRNKQNTEGLKED